MIRRIPLWASPLPLILGVLVWYILWTGYARDFRAEVEQVLPVGTKVETSGFPYRLQAEVDNPRVTHRGTALTAALTADALLVNRVPWQRDRQVISLVAPRLRIALSPITGAGLNIFAPAAQASYHRAEDGSLARLSIVWTDAEFQTGLLPGRLTATNLEFHLRETPGGAAGPDNPRFPTRAQTVISATDMRIRGGDPLSVALTAEATANTQIRSYAGWAEGGTVELQTLTLNDTHGEIAKISATIVPGPDERLRIAGTIETLCPATVRAAFGGTTAAAEKRARRPVTLPFSGLIPGDILVEPADPSKPPPPVRGQEPACPVIVGPAAQGGA